MESSGELPEECISKILSFTTLTPLDACRFALVSRSWRSAADSDAVWEKILPPHYRQILAMAITPVPNFPSMKQLCLYLCQSILIDIGYAYRTNMIWLDRPTGKVGFMLSARNLTILVGNNESFWNWVSDEASRFEEVAYLNEVLLFQICGRFECKVLSPNTRYRVSFLVKIDENRVSRAPFSFSLDPVHGDRMESSRYLDDLERPVERRALPFHASSGGWMEYVDGEWKYTYCDPVLEDHMESTRHLDDLERPVESMTPFIRAANGWMEFVAGEFLLEEDKGISREIRFCMENMDPSINKKGIWIGGVRIEPMCCM